MTSRFRLGRAFGVPIDVHASWLLLGVVLAACLGAIYFRSGLGLGGAAAFGLGVVTASLFAVSVMAHELAHAVAAVRQGREVAGVSLEFAGGRTVLGEGPADAGEEFRIAVAGPLATGALLAALLWLRSIAGLPAAASLVAEHLALMNGLLLAFNLIPALPLDGGRLLRASLWKIWGRPAAASRAAAASGRAFALLLIGLGALGLLSGGAGGPQVVVGVWFVFLGVHLRRVSRQVIHQLWLGEALAGLEARHVLDYRIRAVQRGASLREVEDQEAEFPEIPVVDESRLVGSLRLEDVRRCPEDRRERTTAADVMKPEILRRTLRPGDAAVRACALLSAGLRAIAIVERGELVGVVTMGAVTRRLRLRLSEEG